MYSGKIAVPPGGGGIVLFLLSSNLADFLVIQIPLGTNNRPVHQVLDLLEINNNLQEFPTLCLNDFVTFHCKS
jgi:hypothetical protein